MNQRNLVEVAVVVRTLPYSDGRSDVEARGLDTHTLYQWRQERYRAFLWPGDHLAVYRPATKGKVVYMETLKADYSFERIAPEDDQEAPPEGAG